jgi:hypothetical protein
MKFFLLVLHIVHITSELITFENCVALGDGPQPTLIQWNFDDEEQVLQLQVSNPQTSGW